MLNIMNKMLGFRKLDIIKKNILGFVMQARYNKQHAIV